MHQLPCLHAISAVAASPAGRMLPPSAPARATTRIAPAAAW
jgi:hypothetical protein